MWDKYLGRFPAPLQLPLSSLSPSFPALEDWDEF